MRLWCFCRVANWSRSTSHVSEMSWSTHLKSGDFYKVGDEIEFKILTLDRDERKMSLGVKQLSEDPWSNIDKNILWIQDTLLRLETLRILVCLLN